MFSVVPEPPPEKSLLQDLDPTLSLFTNCVLNGHITQQMNTMHLEDSTLRSTLATTTSAGGYSTPLSEEVRSQCPEFATAAQALRESVNSVGRAYATALDLLTDHDQVYSLCVLLRAVVVALVLLSSCSSYLIHTFTTEQDSV